MTAPLKFILYGLGPIGVQTASYLLERGGMILDGAIDIDPQKVGRNAGEFISGADALGVTVSDRADHALKASSADVVILATSSSLVTLEEQLLRCIAQGKHVVSSCEELAYPWQTRPELASRIDAAARAAGVAVLGTGVNPGFAMDALPIFLTSVCRQVESIRVERHQDAARRRLPFQQKIGAGLTLAEFRARAAAGEIRHVGFTESVQMIAAALGWELEKIEDVVEPVVAERELASAELKAAAGTAAGLRQTATGYRDGRAAITIALQAYLGHPQPKDAITIEGDPPLYSEVPGGLNGDVATCAMLANAVSAVRRATPGLRTMLDVGLTSWSRGPAR